MNFRSWQRWQLIEYALLQKISEEKAVENGKALTQTKQEEEEENYSFEIFSNKPSLYRIIEMAVLK